VDIPDSLRRALKTIGAEKRSLDTFVLGASLAEPVTMVDVSIIVAQEFGTVTQDGRCLLSVRGFEAGVIALCAEFGIEEKCIIMRHARNVLHQLSVWATVPGNSDVHALLARPRARIAALIGGGTAADDGGGAGPSAPAAAARATARPAAVRPAAAAAAAASSDEEASEDEEAS
jgi:hypothetical protein